VTRIPDPYTWSHRSHGQTRAPQAAIFTVQTVQKVLECSEAYRKGCDLAAVDHSMVQWKGCDLPSAGVEFRYWLYLRR